MNIKKVLCPMDFSESSDLALRYAAFIAKCHGAELYMMYVNENLALNDRHMLDTQEIRAKLEKVSEEHIHYFVITGDHGIQLNSEVRQGKASDEIIHMAKQEDIDLIVMGSHGQTGLDHALIGSVAEKVLRTAPCPVLLVKSKIGPVAN